MRFLANTVLLLIGIIILSLFGYYWNLLFPEKILAFQTKTIKLEQTTYRPGDTVTLNVSYCKYKDLVGQHTITLEDDLIFPEYSDVRLLPMGCHTAIYPVVLLAVTPPGKHHFTLRIDYMIRYLFFAGTQESYTISSDPFTVVK